MDTRNLIGLIWKKDSYCNLKGSHDMSIPDRYGHVQVWRSPEVERVYSDCDEETRKIVEDITMRLVLERNSYDICVPVEMRTYPIPVLGIETMDVDAGHPVGNENRTESGIFIYGMDRDSQCYRAGLRIGDVIKEIVRPDMEKVPSKWRRCHYDYPDDGGGDGTDFRRVRIDTAHDMDTAVSELVEGEHVIFRILRDDEWHDVEMDMEVSPVDFPLAGYPKAVDSK